MGSMTGQPPLARILPRVSRGLAQATVAAGLAATVLWFLEWLPSWYLPTLLASITITVGALALIGVRPEGKTARWHEVPVLLVALLAGVTLIYFALRGIPYPGHHTVLAAPTTGTILLMLSLALFGVGREGRWPLLGQSAALLALMLCSLAINGRLQGETGLGSIGARFPMSVPSAILLILLALGILAARPDRGLTAAVIDGGPGGMVARRVALPLMLAPILLNSFFSYGTRQGWYSLETEEGLFTLTTIVLVLVLLAWQVRTLLRADVTRRLLEAATVRAEVEVRKLVDAVTDYAIYSLDAEGRISSWNPGAERIKGYRSEEAIGASDELCLPQYEREAGRHTKMLRQARETGRAEYEGWLIRKGGSRFYGHAILTPVFGDRDELIGYAKVTRDMTEQKNAEDERIKLQTLLNTVVDPIIVIDDRGLIESFNPAAEKAFGYRTSEVLGKNIRMLMPAPHRNKHSEYLRRYQTTGEARVIGLGRTASACRKDGSMFPVELSVSEMKVRGRTKYTGVVRDISEREKAEEALRQSEARLALAVEAGQLGVWDMEVATGKLRTSGPLARNFLTSRVSSTTVDTMADWFALMHPDDTDMAEDQLGALISGQAESTEIEYRVHHSGDGEKWRWMFSRARAQSRDGDGKAEKIIGVTLDIDARKRIEEDLRKSKLDLDIALKDAAFHLWHLHVKTGRVIDLDRLVEKFGYTKNEETESIDFWRRILHPDDLKTFTSIPLNSLSQWLREHSGLELRLLDRSGSWRWMVVRARVIENDPYGNPQVIGGTCLDITERKKAEERLIHAAQHDTLTGLPNRALTYAFGEHILETSTRHGGVCAVLFVDLDRFKPINDTYGHAAGDAVLEEVAERLRHCVRSDDVVGRLGGDEFLVVLAPLPGPDEVSRIAQACLVAVRRPYNHRNLELVISPSIGISLFPSDGQDMQTLVKHADTAMYHAKENGRNNFQFFMPAMNARATSLLRMEHNLRRSIEREEFEMYYQPVVDTEAGRVVAVEALLRWPDSGFGPDEFIPVAESSGLIIPLGEWILREACEQQKKWEDDGIARVRMSVNISPVQFRQQNFLSMVADTVEHCRIDPRNLQLEITESAVLRNVEEVISILCALRERGHRVALDDFGKGYSSLNYLRTLPLDAVKVDKDFVHELSSDPVNLAITEAIIHLGLSLGLQVIAEGIESGDVLKLLRDRNCRHMQGYYLGEPLSATKFEDWYMRSGHSLRRMTDSSFRHMH